MRHVKFRKGRFHETSFTSLNNYGANRGKRTVIGGRKRQPKPKMRMEG